MQIIHNGISVRFVLKDGTESLYECRGRNGACCRVLLVEQGIGDLTVKRVAHYHEGIEDAAAVGAVQELLNREWVSFLRWCFAHNHDPAEYHKSVIAAA